MIHDDSQDPDFCEDSLRPMRTTQQVQFRCLSDEPGAGEELWEIAMICAGKSCLTTRASSTAACHQQQSLQGGEIWGLIGSMI